MNFTITGSMLRGELRARMERGDKTTEDRVLPPAVVRHLLALTDFLEGRAPRQVHHDMEEHWRVVCVLLNEHGTVTCDTFSQANDMDAKYCGHLLKRFCRDRKLRLVTSVRKGAVAVYEAASARLRAVADGA